MDRLSKRERAVLALVAEGRTNQEIAEVLGLATETVRTYLNGAYDTLGLTEARQGSQSKRVVAAVLWVRQEER